VSDAAWIADLLAHGLIRSSFVPEQEVQELRELLPTGKQLIRQQSSHIQRLQKTLEGANIKLDSILTDVVGNRGRAIIGVLIAGETNAASSLLWRIGGSRLPQGIARGGAGPGHPSSSVPAGCASQDIDFADAAIRDIDQRVEALITHMDAEAKPGQAFFGTLIRF
jgi:hypothetical protein